MSHTELFILNDYGVSILCGQVNHYDGSLNDYVVQNLWIFVFEMV